MTLPAICNIPACYEERARGHMFCWSHQIDLEMVEMSAQVPELDEDEVPPMMWVCRHGSLMGDCFLTDIHEFPGLGPTPVEVRIEMAGVTFGLN